MTEQLTREQQDALDFTVGRATNEDLERTVGVHFKNEWVDDDGNAGPVFLMVPKDPDYDPGENDVGDLDVLLARLQQGGYEMVPVRKGDDAEWFTEHYAEALAAAIGVPLWSI